MLRRSLSSVAAAIEPWPSLIQDSVSARDLQLGQRTHARILASGLGGNTFLANNLISMYAKCDSLADARQVFDHILCRDIVSYNSILSAYAVSPSMRHYGEAFALFRQLLYGAVGCTRFTLAPLLKLCSSFGSIVYSECVHGLSVKIGLHLDAFIASPLVDVYSGFGRVDDARCLFDETPDKDLVLWNVMLKGYVDNGVKEDAILTFLKLLRTGLHPDSITLGVVLEACTKEVLNQVQAYSVKTCLSADVLDVVKRNKTMTSYLQDGLHKKVMECFTEMRRMDMECDTVAVIIVLSCVAGANYVLLGRQVHSLVVKLRLDLETSVANNLINMYAKTGDLASAKIVFDTMEGPDLVSWNSIISAYVQTGLEERSIRLFVDLLRNSLVPDHFTFASILCACGILSDSSILSKQVHAHVVKGGHDMDVFVLTSLIDVYAKIGEMEDAECLFNFSQQVKHDLGSWNAMMAGFVTNQDSDRALNLFSLIHNYGERSNEFTLATAIKACGCLVAIEKGKQVHAHAIKLGFDLDLCVSSGILDMYLKCGTTRDASIIFSEMPVTDEVAWTAMISGCVENGDVEHALGIFRQMMSAGPLPDKFTFATLFKACSFVTALEQGKQIHASAIKLEQLSDAYVGTSLVDMYAKCGCIEDSYQLFERISMRSIATWNAMVVAFAQHGNVEKALELFAEMVSLSISPDGITFIGVLSACSHSGLVSKSYEYFDLMQKAYGIEPAIEHYACLVDVLSRAGLVVEAEKLIESMSFEGSTSMYRALLGACKVKGDLEVGKRVAHRLLQLDPTDSAAYVLLSNIYARAHRWDDVVQARKIMKQKNVKKDPGYSWIEEQGASICCRL